MINLIAPKEKEKLLMEKITRMITVLWFLLFFFILCLVLVFWTVRIYAKSQLGVQQSFAASAKEEEKIEKIEQAKHKAELVNSSLEKLNSFYTNKVYFSPLIEKISETLPKSLYLNDFSIMFVKKSDEEDYVIKVSLLGFAPVREDLLEFKSNLETEKDFINVSFPASNWVKKVNIDFSVSFELEV
ncbi:hypothetical protein AMJ47_02105 [Parcubacteria bacterium DG_72]|nr:MAG: hypothetical protein AMJ47_02105 [Parcubacteria bacterium DG_72]